jgi:cytochrome c peroxidase
MTRLVASLALLLAAPLGLPPVPVRGESPSEAKVALGRALFDDKRLSVDGKVSCSSCHRPEHAFTDGLPVARAEPRGAGTRNTPTLLNSAYLPSQFWDGRRETLEEQAADPLVNPLEHALPSHDRVRELIAADGDYAAKMRAAFGVPAEGIGLEHVVRALAAFERTLLAGDSPFDRYVYGHDAAALTEAQARGLGVFTGRARCASCHTVGEQDALFSDHAFHAIGIGQARVQPRRVGLSRGERDRIITSDPEVAELGRFAVTLKPVDVGRFRTPSLRNVALTAPYMHDGSVPTLSEAVERELYYRGLESDRPVILTPREKADLVSFLEALTSASLPSK